MMKSKTYYVTLKRWDHFGEKAVLSRKKEIRDGEVHILAYLLDCAHNEHQIWLKRSDI